MKNFAKTKKLVNFSLDLLFPPFCQRCGWEGTYLCVFCQQYLESPIQRCIVCQKPSLLGETHPECKNKKNFLSGVMVALDYHHPTVQRLIWQLKYNSVKDIAEVLAMLMADYLVREDLLDFFSTFFVVPVPLHKRRERLRGFNQAELLAKHCSKKINLPTLPALQRIRYTKRQVDLEKPQRQSNVAEAFSVSEPDQIFGKNILLVDDVATSGATLNACAKTLYETGAKKIWAMVVARN